MFPAWKPSPEVLLKDFKRKKEYLEECYRQKVA